MKREFVSRFPAKSFLILGLLLVCGLFQAQAADAATVTVGQTASKASSTYFYYNPSGTNAYSVINNAINAAASGATSSNRGIVNIENASEPYEVSSHILAKSYVNIIGQSRGGVVIKIASGLTPTAYGGPGTTGWGGTDSSSGDGAIINVWSDVTAVKIANLTLDGSCGDYYACGANDRGHSEFNLMNVYRATNVTVDNVKFTNGKHDGIRLTGDNMEVSNSVFDMVGHDAVQGYGMDNLKFHNNIVAMRTNAGVRCSGDGSGCYVYNNEFYTGSGGGSALELQGGFANVKVYNNYFHDISGASGSYGAIGYPGQSPSGSGHEYYNNLFVNMPYAVNYVPSSAISHHNIMINCSTTVGRGSDQNNIKTSSGYVFSKYGTNGQGNTYWTVTSGSMTSAFSGLKIGINNAAGGNSGDSTTPTPPPATTYALTINGGTGSGSYAAGTKVTITANTAPSGKVFDRWTGCDSCVASTISSTTTVTVPSSATTLTATYKDAASTVTAYTLTVNNGTGDGSYAAGTKVTISATVPSGQTFDHWTGDTSYISCTASPTPVVTMPSKSITLTAAFKITTVTKYALNVVNGTGDGAYIAGTTVVITANAPISGRVFDSWTGDVSYVESVSSEKTTLTMPAQAVNLTAVYRDATTSTVPALSVSFQSNTITSVEKGATDVQLLAIRVTNSGSENLIMSSIKFGGNFSVTDVSNLRLIANSTPLGTVTRTDTMAEFGGINLTVPKGSSVTLTLRGDITSSTTKTSLTYSSAAITAKGATTGAAVQTSMSNTSSSELTIKSSNSTSGGAVNVTLLPNASSEITPGMTDVQLISYTITNTGNEDVVITGLGYMGDFSKYTLSSGKLYINNTETVSADATSSSGAIFNDLEFVIPKGETFTFAYRGDIAASATNGAQYYQMNRAENVFVAKGMTSGKDTAVTAVGDKASITIKSAVTGLVDGAIMQASNDIDVYIIKIKNGKMFKRVILSPSVFTSYGHLKWGNIIVVDPSVLDDYTTSNLVYVVGNPGKIWNLAPQGDTGMKTYYTQSCDQDSVYEINATDFNSYVG